MYGDISARIDHTAWEITAWVSRVYVERVEGSTPQEPGSRGRRCWETPKDAFAWVV